MKPAPAPSVPGQTDAERFDNAVRAILKVPKEALLQAEKRWKREHGKPRNPTKKPR